MVVAALGSYVGDAALRGTGNSPAARSTEGFWGGVLLAGGLYLLLLMYSVQHSSSNWANISANTSIDCYSPLSHEQLVTTRLIRWGYSLLPASKTMQFLPPATTATGAGYVSPGGGRSFGSGMGAGPGGMPAGGIPGMAAPAGGGGGGFGGMGTAMISNPSYLDITAFTEVGQALWTLLFAWLGGLVAARLYRTQQPKT